MFEIDIIHRIRMPSGVEIDYQGRHRGQLMASWVKGPENEQNIHAYMISIIVFPNMPDRGMVLLQQNTTRLQSQLKRRHSALQTNHNLISSWKYCALMISNCQGSLLLTWFNFIPIMDK